MSGFLSLVAMLALLSEVSLAKSPVEIVLDTGQAIFEHEWKIGQPASPGGDGLGPLHNDVSCVACHSQGGIGGGGPIEKNVSVLSLGDQPAGWSLRQFHKSAVNIHPGFEADPLSLNQNLVLHRFGADPAYLIQRAGLVGTDIPDYVPEGKAGVAEKRVAFLPVRPVPHASGVPLRLSQRNSTSLFGAGLIDRVPDKYLVALAQKQAARGIVSGRVAPTSSGVGRFGWKGQISTLAEFVQGACANELGLQVPGKDQPMTPIRPDYKPVGLDLNIAQLRSLTAYVATLPRPQSETPSDERQTERARRGRKLFMDVGCAHCHVETLGKSSYGIEGVYSDLLLHDMGPKLSDPILASPLTVQTSVDVTEDESGTPIRVAPAGSSYYGGGTTSTSSSTTTRTRVVDRIVPTNRSQEWRTPPLWGVSDSAPYLHDGRASTISEAILFHGGEAKEIVKNYLRLSPSDRRALEEFLGTLTAPSSDEI